MSGRAVVREAGELAERAAVVAYLRELARQEDAANVGVHPQFDCDLIRHGAGPLRKAADAIERGAHLPK